MHEIRTMRNGDLQRIGLAKKATREPMLWLQVPEASASTRANHEKGVPSLSFMQWTPSKTDASNTQHNGAELASRQDLLKVQTHCDAPSVPITSFSRPKVLRCGNEQQRLRLVRNLPRRRSMHTRSRCTALSCKRSLKADYLCHVCASASFGGSGGEHIHEYN